MSIMTVTKDNFEAEVLQCKQTVLLDFWAEWCGPCRMLSPIVDEIAEARNDIVVGKVNVDEELELATQFNVRSIPMLAVIKDGKVTAVTVGYQPRSDIEKLL